MNEPELGSSMRSIVRGWRGSGSGNGRVDGCLVRETNTLSCRHNVMLVDQHWILGDLLKYYSSISALETPSRRPQPWRQTTDQNARPFARDDGCHEKTIIGAAKLHGFPNTIPILEDHERHQIKMASAATVPRNIPRIRLENGSTFTSGTMDETNSDCPSSETSNTSGEDFG